MLKHFYVVHRWDCDQDFDTRIEIADNIIETYVQSNAVRKLNIKTHRTKSNKEVLDSVDVTYRNSGSDTVHKLLILFEGTPSGQSKLKTQEGDGIDDT